VDPVLSLPPFVCSLRVLLDPVCVSEPSHTVLGSGPVSVPLQVAIGRGVRGLSMLTPSCLDTPLQTMSAQDKLNYYLSQVDKEVSQSLRLLSSSPMTAQPGTASAVKVPSP
jgi:hypothetical protein